MIGSIVDGCWEVVEKIKLDDSSHYKLKLKNIYNDRTIIVRNNVFYRIKNGETTVAKIIHYRIERGKNNIQ